MIAVLKILLAALVALFPSVATAQFMSGGGFGGGGGGGGGGAAGVSSFSTTCPATGPSTGAVTLTNGTNAIPYSSSHTMLATECGATIEATGLTTTITGLSTITSGYQYTVCNENASGGANITAAPGGTNTFNGSASNITVVPGQCIGVFAGSGVSPTNWDVAGQAPAIAPMGPGYSAGQNYIGENFAGLVAAGGILTTGTAYCAPQWIMNPNAAGGGTMTVGSTNYNVTTVGTTTITSAIYGDTLVSGLHRPGTLLGYTAQVVNTATGVKTGALNVGVSVAQGLYWFCATQGDSAGKVESMAIGYNMPYVGNVVPTALFTNTGFGVTFAVTYGATAALTWPATAPAPFSEAMNLPPLISWLVSSIP